jgi:hypothetical protein
LRRVRSEEEKEEEGGAEKETRKKGTKRMMLKTRRKRKTEEGKVSYGLTHIPYIPYPSQIHCALCRVEVGVDARTVRIPNRQIPISEEGARTLINGDWRSVKRTEFWELAIAWKDSVFLVTRNRNIVTILVDIFPLHSRAVTGWCSQAFLIYRATALQINETRTESPLT